ncbi:MAG: putative Ig domain-containing protein [Alicyclobacillus sp.]|nr:putative Ig domain-containing protein [Alicyclobacillus sp.]
MRRYLKASVALFTGIALTTLSSPLITHTAQASAVPAASTHAVDVVNKKMSGNVPYALVGRPYHAQLTVLGGKAPYHWQVVSGSVPLGLTFNSNTGLLSGTPKQAGSWNLTISATDANGVVSSSKFTVSILPADERVISVNGFSRPVPVVIQKDLVHKDLTTFISLLDLDGTLGAFGIDVNWNGKRLALGIPNTFTVSGSTTAKNSYSIYVDGLQVETFPNVVKSGGDTFLPLYNVMEALKHVQGLKQTWDGTTWGITSVFASQASTSDDTNSIWNWTGTWIDDSTSSLPTVDITNVTDKSFDFDFDGGRLTGTAHWSGNTATFTDKPRRFSVVFTRTSPTDLTVMVHAGSNNPYFSSLGIPEIRGVYQLEPIQAILSVSDDVATLTGRSRLPVGTTIHVRVGTIYWNTTAQQGGVFQTSQPISYLDNGRQLIQAELTASGQIVGYITNTNTVTTVVHHQSLATDVTRFYQPGTPEYALADFAATDNSVTNADTANAVRDVEPALFSESHFYPRKNSWIVIDGIDIYNVKYTSETVAVVSARIVTSYGSPQTSGWNYRPRDSLMMDTTVNLTKVNGQWLVDVTDLANALFNH